jgi:hypothetical protein
MLQKKSIRPLILISLLLSVTGFLLDSDKVVLPKSSILFEFTMMTIIIFSILFICAFIVKKGYQILK